MDLPKHPWNPSIFFKSPVMRGVKQGRDGVLDETKEGLKTSILQGRGRGTVFFLGV